MTPAPSPGAGSSADRAASGGSAAGRAASGGSFLADPSPVELAAIVAAIEMAWPRPVVFTEETPPSAGPWRFSGRWWSQSHTVQRQRPWVLRSP